MLFKKISLITVLLVLIFIIFSSISLTSANSLDIDSNNNLTNNDIQKIIDDSEDGSTIQFLGDYYNISLTINKKLNIISKTNTKITSNSTKPIFLFDTGCDGSILSGFTLINYGGNGVEINNGKNIVIKNNNIEKSKNGVYIKNSNGINITKNNIKNNENNGIINDNSINTNILNNNITNNYNGIYTVNSDYKLYIYNNNINYNQNDGICLNSDYHNTLTIYKNTIKSNSNHGINLIRQHTVENSIGSLPGIKYNRIASNYGQNVMVKESNYQQIKIGANWYGANKEEFAKVCHKADTTLIQYDVIKYADGIYIGVFHIGNTIVTDLPDMMMNIAIFKGTNSMYRDQIQKTLISSGKGYGIINLKDYGLNQNDFNISSWVDDQEIFVSEDKSLINSILKQIGSLFGNGGNTSNGNSNGNGIGDGNKNKIDESNGNNPGSENTNNNNQQNSKTSGGLNNQNSNENSNNENNGDNNENNDKTTPKTLKILEDEIGSIVKDNPYILAIVGILLIMVIGFGFFYKKK